MVKEKTSTCNYFEFFNWFNAIGPKRTVGWVSVRNTTHGERESMMGRLKSRSTKHITQGLFLKPKKRKLVTDWISFFYLLLFSTLVVRFFGGVKFLAVKENYVPSVRIGIYPRGVGSRLFSKGESCLVYFFCLLRRPCWGTQRGYDVHRDYLDASRAHGASPSKKELIH